MKPPALLLLLTLLTCLRAGEHDPIPQAVRDEQAVSAAAITEILKGVTSVELFSLHPHSAWDSEEVREKDTAPRLSRWKIAGRARLTDLAKIEALRKSLAEGIKDSDGGAMGCFNPRHALKFRSGEEEVVIIVCFECLHGSVTGSKRLTGFLTDGSSQPTFDRIYRESGLEIIR